MVCGKVPESSGLCVVVGFVGRIAADKGIAELLAVWRLVKEKLPAARLVLVGPSIEKRNLVPDAVLQIVSSDPSILMAPATDEVEYYYRIMHILVLPSHREGFPNVVLEAAAMQVPAVTWDTPGCVDSVVDNVTGFVVPFKDIDAFAERIVKLADDQALREAFGRNARERALTEFNPGRINRELLALYSS